MIRIAFSLLCLLTLNGCKGDIKLETQNTDLSKVTITHSNDCYDTDNISSPLALSAIQKQGLYNTVLIETCNQKSQKGYMVFKSILEQYNSNTQLYYFTSKRYTDSPFTKRIENYVKEPILDYNAPNAITNFELYLEQVDDYSVIYSTGGELYFLDEFLRDDYRYQLFITKVRSIYFGLGCSPTKRCWRDFNLANSIEAQNATDYVYKRLHNKVQFNVMDVSYKKRRVYDYYKNKPDSAVKYILSNGTYGNFGEIGAGDLEAILSSILDLPKDRGVVLWNGKQFLFKKDVNGNDFLNHLAIDKNNYLRDVINFLEKDK